MRAALRVNQLRSDGDATGRLAHRAFEHVADSELAPDLLNVDGLAPVAETRIAGDDEEPADAAERGDDLLDHAVGEIFLLRVAAHIGEGQHRGRRLVGKRQCCRSRRQGALGGEVTNPIDAQWAGDVLDLLPAQILEEEGQPVARVLVDRIGDEHAARIGEGFDPCRDVDAVAIKVVALDDHIAEIDADAQFDAIVRSDTGVSLGHRLLHLDLAAHRIDDASKFH